MADLPVARSAIAPTDRTLAPDATVVLTDRSHWSKVLIHDSGRPQAQPTGVAFGEVVPAADDGLTIGWGPGQTLITTDGDVAKLLTEVPDANQGVDVSHGFTMILIAGEGAEATLAKVCAINLSTATKPGTITRTSVAKVATGVVKLDAGFLLLCDRSYGQYLFDEILVAAAEFGVEVVAPRLPK